MTKIHYDVPMVAAPGSCHGDSMLLRQLVLDQIITHPETHDQREWMNGCNTAACVAGWALVYADGRLPQITHDNMFDTEVLARKALGLDLYDSVRLFFYTPAAQAQLALKALANGEMVDWDGVGHRFGQDHDMLRRRMASDIQFRENSYMYRTAMAAG